MQVKQGKLLNKPVQGLGGDFLTIMSSSGLKEKTLVQYRIALNLFEDWRDKPYEELTQLDFHKFINFLREERRLCSSSISLRMYPVRAFMRWYLSGGIQGGKLKGNYPDCVSEITIKKETKKKPDVHITTEILEQFLGECKTLEQKVYFALGYDTGARRSEILNLKVGNVQRDSNGVMVELDGKTGYRKNWLHESIPLLMPYINGMSSKLDDWLFNTTYSWQKTSTGRRCESTVDGWCRSIVKRLKDRGVIDPTDRLRIHSFRHTKARNLKNKRWADDQISLWMGWSKTSKMPSYYGSARPEDVLNRFLEDSGRLQPEQEPESRTCPVCQSVNGKTTKFCSDCGNALRPEFAASRERQMSIKVQAELHQARHLIKQIQSSKFLSEQLGLETA